jgi:glycosyltransferase involved in cell wall biosynthesis
MRLLVISQYYRPEPAPKPSDLAEGLARRGHTVKVVTTLPNYPSGRLYPGFRSRAVTREQLDGVPVTRVWSFPYHGRSTIRRFVNYGTGMIALVIGATLAGPADVIYAYHPPLSTGIAAWIIGRMKRARIVYDVQDIWPDSAVLAGMLSDGWLVRLMKAVERFVYRRAAHIIVSTEGARLNLIAKGVSPDRVSVGAHWIDQRLFEDADRVAPIRATHDLHDRFLVMFAGNIGVVQGLDVVLDAAAQLVETRIVFVLVGDGTDLDRLRHRVDALRLDNVVFLGRQPMDSMPPILRTADALLVHLKDHDVMELVIPTKTIAYLASGRPIVAAVRGPAAALVERARAGITVPPEDPAALASACRRLASMAETEREQLGESGRRYLLAHHTLEGVLADYESVIAAHSIPAAVLS